jgi:hypothetical protein
MTVLSSLKKFTSSMACSGWTPSFLTIVLIFLSSFTCVNRFNYGIFRDDFDFSTLRALATCSSVSLLLSQNLDILCDLFGGEVHVWLRILVKKFNYTLKFIISLATNP